MWMKWTGFETHLISNLIWNIATFFFSILTCKCTLRLLVAGLLGLFRVCCLLKVQDFYTLFIPCLLLLKVQEFYSVYILSLESIFHLQNLLYFTYSKVLGCDTISTTVFSPEIWKIGCCGGVGYWFWFNCMGLPIWLSWQFIQFSSTQWSILAGNAKLRCGILVYQCSWITNKGKKKFFIFASCDSSIIVTSLISLFLWYFGRLCSVYSILVSLKF